MYNLLTRKKTYISIGVNSPTRLNLYLAGTVYIYSSIRHIYITLKLLTQWTWRPLLRGSGWRSRGQTVRRWRGRFDASKHQSSSPAPTLHITTSHNSYSIYNVYIKYICIHIGFLFFISAFLVFWLPGWCYWVRSWLKKVSFFANKKIMYHHKKLYL